jgi:aryl-alcohol dehydrogenase-like predicted oxidoreductase
MWAWQFAKMQHAAAANSWTRFISMQDQYSVVHREEELEMFGLLADQGIGSIPWSPLAGGLVTRPWGESSTTRAMIARRADFDGRPLWLDSDKSIVDGVEGIADARGVSMAQVAMAWVLKNPVVDAPIVGATKQHHLADAVAALDLDLTNEEIKSLEEPYVRRQPTYF